MLAKLGLVGLLAWIALWVAGLIGWVMNIIHIIHAAGGPLTTKLVIEIVGIFVFPIGAVMGWTT